VSGFVIEPRDLWADELDEALEVVEVETLEEAAAVNQGWQAERQQEFVRLPALAGGVLRTLAATSSSCSRPRAGHPLPADPRSSSATSRSLSCRDGGGRREATYCRTK
jgi:hypothetical protein